MKKYLRELLACGLLLVGTWTALGHSLDNDFVNYDDPDYVTRNLQLHSGFNFDGIIWAFTTRTQSHWHPLTLISLAIDIDLWGLNPWGFHLTNLLLHSANVILLFLLLRWMTGSIWRSAVVAGLFAVHPLHVESVAWITERKDVFSTFFMLLTMHAYLYYLEKPLSQRFLLVVLGFALALLSKSMVVTLPCVFLLLDYWPLRRWGWSAAAASPARWGGPFTYRSLLAEKLPLFGLCLISSLVTYVGMKGGGVVRSMENFSLLDFIAYRVVLYAAYLRKMVWPNDLANYYPVPLEPLPMDAVLPATILIGAITILSMWQMRRRPYLLVGWLWYLGTLFPVNGLVQIASYSMADRYTYISLIGIFLAVVWGVTDLVPTKWQMPVLAPLFSGVLIACGVVSWFQVKVWENSYTLWNHSLEVTEHNFMANLQMGLLMRQEGKHEAALDYHQKAVRCWPEHPRLNFYLGDYLLSRKEYAKALPFLLKAAASSERMARHYPEEAERYHARLGETLRQLGRQEEANQEDEKGHALRIKNLERKRQ